MNKLQDFKNALKSYSYHVNCVKNLIEELKWIDQHIVASNFIESTTRQAVIKQDLQYHEYQVRRVNNILKKLSIKDEKIVKLIYFNGKRYEDVCYDYPYSDRGLKYYIDRILTEALEE